MAVVVLPTPPFWFAMATIIRIGGHLTPAIPFVDRIRQTTSCTCRDRPRRGSPATSGAAGCWSARVRTRWSGRCSITCFLDEDGRPGAQRERDGIARARVDGDRLATDGQVDQRVEGVLLQVADDHLVHRAVERLDDVAQQVVGHRTLRRDVLDLQADGVGLVPPDPDRQHALPVLVPEDDDRVVRDGVEDEPLMVISICMFALRAPN